MSIAVKVENLSKAYQIGEIGTGTLANDLKRWYARSRGKEDPFLKIGETNDRAVKGTSNVVWSLKDINFEIEQGDAVGIIGKNGAGKSTLLKILSRVTSPTTGKITGNGRVASLLEVGTGFHPELTGKDNIYLNGAILGMRKKEIKRKFDEIVDFSGVERYINTPVKRYSSGMYVRLAFAVAAYLESEILIVDEVLAVGDAEFQKKCLGKMKDVSKGEGRTVLFVSHNMGAIQALCNKAIFLEKGFLKFSGPQADCITRYLNEKNKKSGDLISNRERIGTGELTANKIYLVDEQGNLIENILSGQTFRICIDYTIKKFLKLKNVLVGISVINQLDQPVFLFHNRLTKDNFGMIDRDGTFICTIIKNPLVPSTYSFSYSIMHENGYGDYIDHLSNVYSFSVEQGNFYISGETPPATHGQTLVEGRWEICQTNIK